MKLKIINTESKFKVQVIEKGKILHTCGWTGDERFEIKGRLYSILGPSHGEEDDKFHLYVLEEIACG